MNKEKRFKHYKPFLEYLFGPMSDQEYGALFWPGSTNAKHNFSMFITDGEKKAEVIRRIAALLQFDPNLLSQLRLDVGLDNQIDVDAVANLTIEQICSFYESWRLLKIVEALSESLKLIAELAACRDANVSIVWTGISVLLQRANRIPLNHLRRLEKDMNCAIEACCYMKDPKPMIEAEIMFRCKALTLNNVLRQRNSHTQITEKFR